MELDKATEVAQLLSQYFRAKVLDESFELTHRNRLARAASLPALDHHCAIAILFSKGLYGPALALERLQFEAMIRGKWLLSSADEGKLLDYAVGDTFPRIDKMIADIESRSIMLGSDLSQQKRVAWLRLNDQTHGGGYQLRSYSVGRGVKFDKDDIMRCIDWSNMIGFFAALTVSEICGSMGFSEEVSETYWRVYGREPPSIEDAVLELSKSALTHDA